MQRKRVLKTRREKKDTPVMSKGMYCPVVGKCLGNQTSGHEKYMDMMKFSLCVRIIIIL